MNLILLLQGAALVWASIMVPYRAPPPVPAVFESTRPIQWKDSDEKELRNFIFLDNTPDIIEHGLPLPEHWIRYRGKLIDIIDQNRYKSDRLDMLGDNFKSSENGLSQRIMCSNYYYKGSNSGGNNWYMLILVLYTDKFAVAYRFDGFIPECRDLRTDGKGIFLVPIVQELRRKKPDETGDAAPLGLVWNVCTIKGCQHYIDPRRTYFTEMTGSFWVYTDPGYPPHNTTDFTPFMADLATKLHNNGVDVDWLQELDTITGCRIINMLSIRIYDICNDIVDKNQTSQ